MSMFDMGLVAILTGSGVACYLFAVLKDFGGRSSLLLAPILIPLWGVVSLFCMIVVYFLFH